jgi:hypothetical protein
VSTSARALAVTATVIKLPQRVRYAETLIAAGDYDAILVSAETWARCHGWAPRVVLLFTISDAGNVGVTVAGYYRVGRLEGKPRRNGRFMIGSRSRLYRDLARMLGRRPPTDRVPHDVVGKLYRVTVRVTSTDRDGHPLGAAAYSVIDWVQGPV